MTGPIMEPMTEPVTEPTMTEPTMTPIVDEVAVVAVPRRGRRFSFSPVGMVAAAVILFWVVIAFIGPWIIPHPVGEIIDDDFFGPLGGVGWLGTDYLGRDMLSRTIMGARYTVGISVVSVCIASGLGVLLGMTAAVARGWTDIVLSRLLDAASSIPSKLFGLLVVAALGSSIPVLIVTLGIIYTPGAYRFARALGVNIGAMDFILVAKARGERVPYLIRTEILPNITGPVLADLGLRYVFIVLLLSGLSFLGLGLQPPYADWGALVRENIGGLSQGAPAVIVPSIAIATLTISVNLFIDNLPRRIRDRAA